MANYRKSLKNPRSQAFHAQHGRCYYCNQPMWTKTPLELVSRFRINQSQAKLLHLLLIVCYIFAVGLMLLYFSKNGIRILTERYSFGVVPIGD